MKKLELRKALATATSAAQQAGALMRRHMGGAKKINERSRYDIKIELDVRCQQLITRILLDEFPAWGILGEEGSSGVADAPARWVVDPIDGTVNFVYGVPHACVSIALQERSAKGGEYTTVLGVVYDPFCNELWTATQGAPARLNGKVIRVSPRTKLEEAMVAIGFAKDPATLQAYLPVFDSLAAKVLKARMMGSAALSLAYVAGGRFDGYVESGVSLWDIAAAGFILERAGGDFSRRRFREARSLRCSPAMGCSTPKLERLVREAREVGADNSEDLGLRIGFVTQGVAVGVPVGQRS